MSKVYKDKERKLKKSWIIGGIIASLIPAVVIIIIFFLGAIKFNDYNTESILFSLWLIFIFVPIFFAIGAFITNLLSRKKKK